MQHGQPEGKRKEGKIKRDRGKVGRGRGVRQGK